jgi:diguanylate cyclase (GGDEF)-like protein
MNTNTPIAAAELAAQTLFAGVEPETLATLAAAVQERRLAEGETLLAPGRNNEDLYVLLEGRLQVTLEPGVAPVALIECGETVGELSVIDHQQTSAHVTAALPSRLAVIDPTTLWQLVDASAVFGRNLLLMVTRRLRAGNEHMLDSQRRQRQWEHFAKIDPLTSLHNRRWLDETAPRQMERCRRSGEPMSLLMIDIDHFKDFNDAHGHPAGDQVLIAVGRVFSEQLRPTDTAVRYGGEEFCILLPVTERIGALLTAERLRTAIGQAEIVAEDGTPLPHITASIGVAAMEGNDSPSSLIGRADAALYRAKQGGRDRVA